MLTDDRQKFIRIAH